MCIFSLYMHSDSILIHLLEFGSILSIFYGFSSKRRKCAFFASQVFRRYLQTFARVWFTSGDFSRILDKNTSMCIFSLYMHSDTIFMHLLEFGPILSIIHGFSSKNVNVHFIALHVYRHYLQAFARVWFTSGDFSRIFDKNTSMCIFRFTCIPTLFSCIYSSLV